MIILIIRIIPTRVGTRKRQKVNKKYFGDHPHACGDKTECKTTRSIKEGSSPRVWGQEPLEVQLTNGYRIIPTRVGTSHTKRIVTAVLQDHPHACGDKPFYPICKTFRKGSSPRVWGQVKLEKGKTATNGIIPTRVGTSFVLVKFCNRIKDHPHACGDK